MIRQFGIAAPLEQSISEALKALNTNLQEPKELAKNVLMLSDFFIQNPLGQTPWNDTFAQIAYLCYYLPLNSARLSALIQEAQARHFFKDLENVIDFGAGLATASLSLLAQSPESFQKYFLIERSSEPQKLVEIYFSFFQAKNPTWLKAWDSGQFKKNNIDPKKTMALFSYSLTELKQLPDWASECEALFIAEPSTQQDGRKLLELRNQLLKKGFHVWAPCTHTMDCPLLTQSKNDWCHDRIHFKGTNWFDKMEDQLPMKNKTLTVSYLLMRKTPPPKIAAARVVGDNLKEKGKDRQLICRGTDREFLAWMHKHGPTQEIPRGALVEIPDNVKKVANEIRVSTTLSILK